MNRNILILIIILLAAFGFYYFMNLPNPIISTQPIPRPAPAPKPSPQPQAYGTLTGKMTIGPICPVERIDQPCLPTPKMYAARVISIYSSDRSKLIATTSPNANGIYSFRLPVGNYIVDMAHAGIGGATGVPASIKISKNTTTTLNIDVDTGIR